MISTIELPCSVGDKVFDRTGELWYVNSIEIYEKNISLHCERSICSPTQPRRKTFTIGKHSINRTVFLSDNDYLAYKVKADNNLKNQSSPF